MSRIITAKYQGTCTDCGAPVYPGEQCEHYARGKIRCSDCMADNQTPSAPTVPVNAPKRAPADTSDKWAAAMQWDSKAPEPGASVGSADARPRASRAPVVPIASQRFIDTRTGEIVEAVPIHKIAHFSKYAGPRAVGEFDTESELYKRAQPEPETPEPVTATPEPAKRETPTASQCDIVARLIHEQLVTTLNAISTLSDTQRRDVARSCRAMVSVAGSAERGAMWRKFADALQ